MRGYISNIEELTKNNNNFRQVLFTATHTQLVVMSLLPSEEIGMEAHNQVDQFFRIEQGTVQIEMEGEKYTLTDGMVAVVPAGTKHNLTNVGSGSAKLYTLYSPANHPQGTIHKTKAEAIADEHDH